MRREEILPFHWAVFLSDLLTAFCIKESTRVDNCIGEGNLTLLLGSLFVKSANLCCSLLWIDTRVETLNFLIKHFSSKGKKERSTLCKPRRDNAQLYKISSSKE